MDATRNRRLKDRARQTWYGRWRTYRLARHMGMSRLLLHPGRTWASFLAEVIPWPPLAPVRCATAADSRAG